MDNVFKMYSVDTVSYALTLANHNSDCLLPNLKGALFTKIKYMS